MLNHLQQDHMRYFFCCNIQTASPSHSKLTSDSDLAYVKVQGMHLLVTAFDNSVLKNVLLQPIAIKYKSCCYSGTAIQSWIISNFISVSRKIDLGNIKLCMNCAYDYFECLSFYHHLTNSMEQGVSSENKQSINWSRYSQPFMYPEVSLRCS
jgi:hypothetical protein